MEGTQTQPTGRERRAQTRYPVLGQVSHLVLRDRSGSLISFFPIDVSEHGLGIIIDHALTVGTVLELYGEATAREAVRVQVVWVQRSFEALDVYRCGLMLLAEEADLLQVFDAVPTLLIDREDPASGMQDVLNLADLQSTWSGGSG